jgi:hypothetical protein
VPPAHKTAASAATIPLPHFARCIRSCIAGTPVFPDLVKVRSVLDRRLLRWRRFRELLGHTATSMPDP